MRGRSLLKESACPSVCAFCAHRLGQARRPSHVQRRFLQSSCPVSRPPAEGAALKEDNGNSSPRPNPSWGAPINSKGKGNNLGSKPSWGASGGIPAAGNWGQSSSSVGNGIPAASSQSDAPNHAPMPELLDPHEQRARDLMLASITEAQKRKIDIPRGAGPESTRAGRPIFERAGEPIFPRRRQEEELENARQALERKKARESSKFWRPREIANGTIVRKVGFVIGDDDPTASKNSQPVEDSNSWGQLKRREAPQEPVKPRDLLTEARAQREQEASLRRYTPVGSRSILDSSSFSGGSWGQRDPQKSPLGDTRGSRWVQKDSQQSLTADVPPEGSSGVQKELQQPSPASVPSGSSSWGQSDSQKSPFGNIPPRGSPWVQRDSQQSSNAGIPSAAISWGQRDSKQSQFANNLSRGISGGQEPQKSSYQDSSNIRAGPEPVVKWKPFVDESSNREALQQNEAAFNSQSFESPAHDRFRRVGSVSSSNWDSVTQEPAIREPTKEPEQIRPSKKQEEEVQEYERPIRPKKGRERFTLDEPSFSSLPKGKERDKAKRRQQFGYEVDGEDAEAEREAAKKRAELKKQRKREKAARKPVPILLPEFISVSNLSIALRVRLEEFIEKMQELGFEETNHDFILNSENAGLIAMEYNFEPIIDRGDSEDLKAREPPADPSILPSRPPVVTIMGHVDHGKTTILDYLRKSSVAATEHGGITQHIGAFSVPMPSGKTITFLDTPGHAAFLAMRQRGANVTDIVILVVAADDSVKPQTIEAINHAKAAKVPIIVAINKIDKEESNIERVKQDLSRYGVDVEDFGGDTQVVCVSGKTGQGMEQLEEAAVALSDILDVRAERDGPAEGAVIEASIKSMGKVATVLVKRGTMRPGDFIVAGKTWARIRCLRNEAGIDIEEAGPGTPVEIDGWREQPLAGDEVLEAPDEQKAKAVVDFRLEKEEREKMAEDMEAINDSRKVEQERKAREKLEAMAEAEGTELEMPEEKVGGPKQIYFIVKGDVSGSVEAVMDSIGTLGNKEVQPHVLRSGVGQLSEFDIEHAAAAKGHVINFNTEVEPHITRLAEQAKVNIIDQNIIYRLVDDVKAELSKYLPPLFTQRVLGEAEIAQVFSITVKGRKQKNIAGCKVRNGTIAKNSKVRVMRNGEKVFDGTLASLKSVKRDVPEMKKGSECGMGFEDWFEFQVGDQVRSYEEKEEKRYL
ncbi:hypothetical protein G7Y89_g271 [Cudoniella acicularis]|uniref:Translation initiation factor IF-2, mitochondrial n=1 Tax=Cudoniella acicularis TaxID=354080 RepID=A0A8H4WBC1_9HELO|nr:hypothetical protein G7Y89_g271 [Cudoniella acicularis]